MLKENFSFLFTHWLYRMWLFVYGRSINLYLPIFKWCIILRFVKRGQTLVDDANKHHQTVPWPDQVHCVERQKWATSLRKRWVTVLSCTWAFQGIHSACICLRWQGNGSLHNGVFYWPSVHLIKYAINSEQAAVW